MVVLPPLYLCRVQPRVSAKNIQSTSIVDHTVTETGCVDLLIKFQPLHLVDRVWVSILPRDHLLVESIVFPVKFGEGRIKL